MKYVRFNITDLLQGHFIDESVELFGLPRGVVAVGNKEFTAFLFQQGTNPPSLIRMQGIVDGNIERVISILNTSYENSQLITVRGTYSSTDERYLNGELRVHNLVLGNYSEKLLIPDSFSKSNDSEKRDRNQE